MATCITLRPGGGHAIPERICFLDVEPNVKEMDDGSSSCLHTFKCGFMAWNRLNRGERVSRFARAFLRPGEFFDQLLNNRDTRRATWVIGHNVGYDLTLLGFWDWLESVDAELIDCCLADPPTFITIRYRGRLIKFVDTLNYWRLSVKDLAASVGMDSGRTDTPLSRQSCAMEHCQFHVEVIEKCFLRLINFLSATSCCSLRVTAASLSWGAFVTSFLSRKLYLSSDNRARTLERRAYFGGRVSVSVYGSVRERVSVLDINSLYPHVMQTNLFPCELVYHRRGMRPADLKAALRYFDCVADVYLRGDQYPYPCRTGAGVDFVPGCPHTVLAGDELRVACENCDVVAVKECYLYAREELFSSFVRHFYALKASAVQAGNRANAMIYKLFLNSLHGKFAQKGRQWMPAPNTISKGFYAWWWKRIAGQSKTVRCRSIAGKVEEQETGPDPRHAFPAISAHITSSARVLLENDIKTAGVSNVLYCDTDSIHTLAPGRERLDRLGRLDATKLGHYRVHASGPDAYYFGRQYYRVGDTTVCSSIKPDAIEISDGIYLQDAKMGVERCLENGRLTDVMVARRKVDMTERSIHARRHANTA